MVLDASVVLALLYKEKGFERVKQALASEDALMSAVNYAEVLTKLIRQGMKPVLAKQAIGVLSITIVPFSDRVAFEAAALYPQTKKQGLSLGDRSCLALGFHTNKKVLTADKAWQGLVSEVDVEVIR